MNVPLISGVILVTGEHGTGKTTLALESGSPSGMWFVDDDLKGNATVKQIRSDGVEFGRYINFIEETQGMKALDVHMKGLEIIEKIESNGADVVVWDTWTRFASSCHAYVVAHPNKFRDPDNWAAMGKIRSGEEYKEARLYEADLISRLQSKARLVVLVSHLKNQYLNNAPTGKEIPAVSKAVDRVCNLRLWLRHNPESHTPIGLVLKNIDRKIYDPDLDRLRTVKILPTKITPQEAERSLWDAIYRYYNDPAGLREPLAHEIPDNFESSIVEGTLTEDQRLSWLYAIRQERERAEEEEMIRALESRARAREMKEEGASFAEISKALDIPIKQAVQILREEDEEGEE